VEVHFDVSSPKESGVAGLVKSESRLSAAALFVGAGAFRSSFSVAASVVVASVVHMYRMQGDLNTKMFKIFILIRQNQVNQSKFLHYLGKNDILSHVVIILSFTQFFLLYIGQLLKGS